MSEPSPPSEVLRRRFSFLKAGVDEFSTINSENFDWFASAKQVQGALSEALSARNIAFLMGAGCSSMVIDGSEVGISTMYPLAQEFTSSVGKDPSSVYPTAKENAGLIDQIGLDISRKEFSTNLEHLMEVLYTYRYALSSTNLSEMHSDRLRLVEGMIEKVQRFLWNKCTAGLFSFASDHVVQLYEAFYRRLVYRDRSLPQPWIFTTNYDRFNETAMDRIGIPYCNGFSGVVERRFNPATFRYSLAEQIDISSKRWTAVDSFVYLAKLHGSVSWIEDNHGLFPIRELPPGDKPGQVMIYPTPAKQNASLASPYSDLFREFQGRLLKEQSILVTLGFAFGDQHINNIIYQALTIPTFRLIIFASPNSAGEIGKLRDLHDPRIWIIGGDGPTADTAAHYFTNFVNHFMPSKPNERIDNAVQKVLNLMTGRNTSDGQ